MPDDPAGPNTLRPQVRGRSRSEDDVPDAVRRRYYTDGRGGPGLGFYVDTTVRTPAFRDQGRQLTAPRADSNAIRDMVAIARHRKWSTVAVRGAVEFRREAWLAARAAGLEVRGHRPSQRDVQALERRIARRAADITDRPDLMDRTLLPRQTLRRDPGVADPMKVVDTVVRARVRDPAAQDRILIAARERIADWLERGPRFDALQPSRTRPDARERSRGG